MMSAADFFNDFFNEILPKVQDTHHQQQRTESQQQQQQQQQDSDSDDFYGHYATVEQTFVINYSMNLQVTLVPSDHAASHHEGNAASLGNERLEFGTSVGCNVIVTQPNQQEVVVSDKRASRRKKKKKQPIKCQKDNDSAFSIFEKQPIELQLESSRASAHYRLRKCCASNNFGRDVNLITVVKSCKSFSNSMRVCVHTSGRYLCWWRVRFKPFSNTFHPLSSEKVVSQRRHHFAHLNRFHIQRRKSTHHTLRHRLQRQSHSHTHITIKSNSRRSPSSSFFMQRKHRASVESCAVPAFELHSAWTARSFQWWRAKFKPPSIIHYHRHLHTHIKCLSGFIDHQQLTHTHIIGKCHHNALQSSACCRFKQRSVDDCKVGPAAFTQRSRASALRNFQWWRHRFKSQSSFFLIIFQSGTKTKSNTSLLFSHSSSFQRHSEAGGEVVTWHYGPVSILHRSCPYLVIREVAFVIHCGSFV